MSEDESVTLHIQYGFAVLRHEPLVTWTSIPPAPMTLTEKLRPAFAAVGAAIVGVVGVCAATIVALLVHEPALAPLLGISVGMFAYMLYGIWRD